MGRVQSFYFPLFKLLQFDVYSVIFVVKPFGLLKRSVCVREYVPYV